MRMRRSALLLLIGSSIFAMLAIAGVENKTTIGLLQDFPILQIPLAMVVVIMLVSLIMGAACTAEDSVCRKGR